MAAKSGAHEIIENIIQLALEKQNTLVSRQTMTFIYISNQKETSQHFQVLKKGLIASNELTNKQPDIFNEKSLFLMIQILNAKNLGDEFILLVLQHLKHATLLHEINRQNIMNVGILTSLKPLLKTNNTEVSRKRMANLFV